MSGRDLPKGEGMMMKLKEEVRGKCVGGHVRLVATDW